MLSIEDIKKKITEHNSANQQNTVKTLEEFRAETISALTKLDNPYKDVGDAKLKEFGQQFIAKIRSSLFRFSSIDHAKSTEILNEIAGSAVQSMIQAAAQEVVEAQEDPKAGQYIVLFRRLYGKVGDKPEEQKFNLSDEGRYLVHAILQMGLYSMKQECCISLGIQKDCINDGTNACVISKGSFLGLGKHEVVGNKVDTNTKLKNNPGTQQPIKPETFYFYNCHIEAGKFNNSNTHDRFGNGFESYKTAYDKAIEILLGLIEVDKSLPEEIKNVVNDLKNNEIFQKELKTYKLIQSLTSETDIFKVLDMLKDIDCPLNVKIDFNQLLSNATTEILKEVIKFAEEIKNEQYKSLVLEVVADNENATTDVLNKVIKFAEEIKNEEYKFDVLRAVASNAKDETVLNEVIKFAEDIKNELYKSLVLQDVIGNNNATTDVLNKVIKFAEGMKNEEKKAYVLRSVAWNKEATVDVLQEVIKAAKDIKNEQYKFDVLKAVADNENATTDILQEVIKFAEGMNEQYKSLVLEAVASNAKATTDVLNKVIKFAEEIKDEQYKSLVLSAVKSNPNFKSSHVKQGGSYVQMIENQSQQQGGQNQGNGI